ncbi:VOC family protein [Vibrio mimicus]|uniref:VOC family protein n=1 Tax=Vibrio mimicus TaxID=674 RepID=UPI0001BAE1AD|nr:VOC family protein [Vibrio mimicus]EEY46608.1 glyoxalase [Vibrio mimicus VM223]
MEEYWNPMVPELSVSDFAKSLNFQIELSDIAPVYDRLESAGVSLFKEQKDTWYDVGDSLSGQREFLVQDPDGYLLRFSQYLGEKSKP